MLYLSIRNSIDSKKKTEAINYFVIEKSIFSIFSPEYSGRVIRGGKLLASGKRDIRKMKLPSMRLDRVVADQTCSPFSISSSLQPLLDLSCPSASLLAFFSRFFSLLFFTLMYIWISESSKTKGTTEREKIEAMVMVQISAVTTCCYPLLLLLMLLSLRPAVTSDPPSSTSLSHVSLRSPPFIPCFMPSPILFTFSSSSSCSLEPFQRQQILLQLVLLFSFNNFLFPCF